MSIKTRILVFLSATAMAAVAAPITFSGPVFPKPGPTQGLPCNPSSDIGCVIGDPLKYEPFQAQLTQPGGVGQNWLLTIQTNYGDSMQNLLPGVDGVPTFLYEAGGSEFSIGDFLITWNGATYGVVLHSHDGYQAGNLYKASGVQTSFDIMQGKTFQIVNATFPILLAAGGVQQGTGSLSGAITGDAVNSGRYTFTVSFSAPADFLSTGSFGISFSSYACGNGVLIGSGGFTGGDGGGGSVPEPSTFMLLLPSLGLIGYLRMRRGSEAR